MVDPKEVLTKDGYQAWQGHLFNFERALFFITNHVSDLEIGATSEDENKILEAMYTIQRLMDKGVLQS
jgi:hypothetical protein